MSDSSYIEKNPKLYPPSVQWALILAEENWRRQREIALEQAEAFEMAWSLVPLWRGAEKPEAYLSFPGGLSLWGVFVKARLTGREHMRLVEPLLEGLSDGGWNLSDGSDYAEIKRRHWDCTKGKARITLMVFTESELCRVVEDGTETKFKIVCEEAA